MDCDNLKGGKAEVAYNPDDVSAIWLLEQGKYVRFELIEGRFKGMELKDVEFSQGYTEKHKEGAF